MAESRTVVNLGVACSGLRHFLRVASSGLCHLMGWPNQDSVVFLHSGTKGIKGVARIAVHPVITN